MAQGGAADASYLDGVSVVADLVLSLAQLSASFAEPCYFTCCLIVCY